MIKTPNPCRKSNDCFGRNTWYPYYAGYSPAFAKWAIQNARISPAGLVADPWNGGGTTSWAATHCRLESWGGDLNPAMLVVAKSKLLSFHNCLSLATLARKLLRGKLSVRGCQLEKDPLRAWLDPALCTEFRAIERRVLEHVIPGDVRGHVIGEINELSEIAAFFYLALFLLAREQSRLARASNPTWTARRKEEPSLAANCSLKERFIEIVDSLLARIGDEERGPDVLQTTAEICVSSSQELPLQEGSVDLVLTSPPYCTRIDYAVATSIELAVLGATDEQLDKLRRSLMGTTTVPKKNAEVDQSWGSECLHFLEKVRMHKSYASSGYYYKSHTQYYCQLHRSLAEIARVLKSDGQAVLVVQDSYYKDVHNDLASITQQMASGLGLHFLSKSDFEKRRSMRAVHPSREKYGSKSFPVETVLFFQKIA